MILKTTNSSLIAKNSLLLYLRMIVVMVINLYTVRLVLQALGIVDYGIYDVVAGVITMLMSISSVLSTATQRYYSYSIGLNKIEKLKEIFSSSINIYIFLSIFVFLFGETVGLWFINTKLLIPHERLCAANWIYQFSIFSFIFTFMQVPYSAAIIAHEDMSIFALISTVECILKLISALLIFVIPIDSLIVYGANLFFISAFVLFAYVFIGHRKYAECRYQKITEKSLLTELISFSGWSLFGSIASVGMTQVITILVNIFFGPLVNTARAISFQFNMALSSLTASFLMAVRPQMIKSYAEGSYFYLNKIFNLSNKVIYYSLLMVCLPLFFEMDIVLLFWLKNTNEQTILFSRLILIYALVMALNNPISIIIQATGHVKEYHVSVEIFTLLCVPVTYLCFKFGFQAYSSYLVMIGSAILAHFVRLICLKRFYSTFSYTQYFKSFVLPAFAITVIVSNLILLIHKINMTTIFRFPAIIFVSVLSISALVFFIGINKSEKADLKKLVNTYLKK